MKATTTLAMMLAAAIACGGGSKQSAAPATQPAAADPGPPPEPPKPKGSSMGVGADAVRARSSFAMFPSSTRLVGGVSLAQLRSSAAWPALQALLDQRAGPDLQELRDVCKLDAAKAVDSIEFALAFGEQMDLVLVFDGSFTRAGIARCGPAFAASRGHTLAVTDDGAITSYDDGNDALWIGWPSENRAVSIGDERGKDWLASRLAGEDSVRDDEAFMELVGNVDTAATGWVAVVDENGNFQVLGVALEGRVPTAAFASVRVSDVVKGEVGLVFETEGDAKVASGALQKQLDGVKNDPMFGSLASTAHVGVYGANAVVEFDLNQQQFEKLIQLLVAASN